MATTTPNFGWSVPTSTDYVKDGALAIETLGDAIDASLVDLKGGASGYILSKNSASDMDFAWIPNALPATPAGINKILNGDFGIWQRGTTITNPNNTSTFAADRWLVYRADLVTGLTASRQDASLSGFRYCMRVQRANGNTGLQSLQMLYNTIETNHFMPLQGKTVTFSFYARAGANYSATGGALKAIMTTGTGTDQSPFSYTGAATAIDQNVTLTTSWQRFTITATLGATATEAYVQFTATPTGTAGANDYFEITGVQLEVGDSATPFTTATGNPASELVACQRYYYRTNADAAYSRFALGFATSTTEVVAILNLPVTMRTVPTVLDYSSLGWFDSASSFGALSSLTFNNSTRTSIYLNGIGTGLTANRPTGIWANNSTSAYIGFSAEL